MNDLFIEHTDDCNYCEATRWSRRLARLHNPASWPAWLQMTVTVAAMFAAFALAGAGK